MAAGDTTDGEGRGGGGRRERGCTQNGGECERADSDDDSIEKRAMGEREGGEWMGARGRSVGLVLEDWDPDKGKKRKGDSRGRSFHIINMFPDDGYNGMYKNGANSGDNNHEKSSNSH